MKMTYEDAARILAIVDMAEGEDLDFTLDNRRISLTAWPAKVMAAPQPAPAALRPEVADSGLVEVRAKRLGLYRAVKGVRVGAQMSEGDVVAMLEDFDGKKHPVEALTAGRVVEICVEPGDFAEYGQSLVTIDTAGVRAKHKMSRDHADAVGQS